MMKMRTATKTAPGGTAHHRDNTASMETQTVMGTVLDRRIQVDSCSIGAIGLCSCACLSFVKIFWICRMIYLKCSVSRLSFHFALQIIVVQV